MRPVNQTLFDQLDLKKAYDKLISYRIYKYEGMTYAYEFIFKKNIYFAFGKNVISQNSDFRTCVLDIETLKAYQGFVKDTSDFTFYNISTEEYNSPKTDDKYKHILLILASKIDSHSDIESRYDREMKSLGKFGNIPIEIKTCMKMTQVPKTIKRSSFFRLDTKFSTEFLTLCALQSFHKEKICIHVPLLTFSSILENGSDKQIINFMTNCGSPIKNPPVDKDEYAFSIIYTLYCFHANLQGLHGNPIVKNTLSKEFNKVKKISTTIAKKKYLCETDELFSLVDYTHCVYAGTLFQSYDSFEKCFQNYTKYFPVQALKYKNKIIKELEKKTHFFKLFSAFDIFLFTNDYLNQFHTGSEYMYNGGAQSIIDDILQSDGTDQEKQKLLDDLLDHDTNSMEGNYQVSAEQIDHLPNNTLSNNQVEQLNNDIQKHHRQDIIDALDVAREVAQNEPNDDVARSLLMDIREQLNPGGHKKSNNNKKSNNDQPINIYAQLYGPKYKLIELLPKDQNKVLKDLANKYLFVNNNRDVKNPNKLMKSINDKCVEILTMEIDAYFEKKRVPSKYAAERIISEFFSNFETKTIKTPEAENIFKVFKFTKHKNPIIENILDQINN